jgi:hypothetical protein
MAPAHRTNENPPPDRQSSGPPGITGTGVVLTEHGDGGKMIRHYCDGCEAELTRDNSCASATNPPSFHTVMMSHPAKPDWTVRLEARDINEKDPRNAYVYCKYCLFDAVIKADDRAKCDPK